MRPAAAAATAACCALCIAAAALAAASPAVSVPARDRFTGSVEMGTGSFGGDNGRFSLKLVVRSTGATRAVSVVFDGRRCRHVQGCIDLQGRLTGTLAPGPRQNPDAGQAFTLSARGRLAPLGRGELTGTVHGTGFIAEGQETMQMTFAKRPGSVDESALQMSAHSGAVRGNTGP